VALLDEVMPVYDAREVHSTWCPGPPEAAWEAALAVTAREVRLFGPLMLARTLGRSARAFDTGAPLLGEMRKVGFVDLGERPGTEIVLGAVGRFWSLLGNRPVATDDFRSFAEPGYAKAAMSFVLSPEGGGTRVTTETRITTTDDEARRRFRRYWLAVRLPSGAIRRSWLKAIRRRLERQTT
jgi:hypothetical protein